MRLDSGCPSFQRRPIGVAGDVGPFQHEFNPVPKIEHTLVFNFECAQFILRNSGAISVPEVFSGSYLCEFLLLSFASAFVSLELRFRISFFFREALCWAEEFVSYFLRLRHGENSATVLVLHKTPYPLQERVPFKDFAW